jgi:hypothetical protein
MSTPDISMRRASFASAPPADGKVTVVHEDSPGKFSVVETIETQRGAKTMAYDAARDLIYLPTAEGLP